MTEPTENLILEHLKVIRIDLSSIRDRLDDVTARVTSLEHHMVAVVGGIFQINGRLDHIDLRVNRIERRLDLVSE